MYSFLGKNQNRREEVSGKFEKQKVMSSEFWNDNKDSFV